VPMQGVQPRMADAQTQMVQDVCNSLQQVTQQLQKLVVAPAPDAGQPDYLNLNVEKALGGNRIAYTEARPGWAEGLVDRRKLLQWDSEQYVAQVGIGKCLALGVVDTGSCKTLMCDRTASALGLTIERARGNEFGSYRVPGGDESRAYVGVVRGPVTMRFGADMAFELANIRVLTHPAPLLLLGSDLLRGGDMSGHVWNFDGLR
jgi:hypothetical protein